MSDEDRRSDKRNGKPDRERKVKPPPFDPDPRIITEFERARRGPRPDKK